MATEAKNGAELMPWRLKYPEAESRRNHYRDLVSSLTANRTAIQSKVNGASTVNAASVNPTNVDGVYYDRYIIARDTWIRRHGQTIAAFNTFLTDLDTCITNASNLQTMWQNRIGIREWYE